MVFSLLFPPVIAPAACRSPLYKSGETTANWTSWQFAEFAKTVTANGKLNKCNRLGATPRVQFAADFSLPANWQTDFFFGTTAN
jgi:hypothetical protein